MIISGEDTSLNTNNIVEIFGEIVKRTNIYLNADSKFMDGYHLAVGSQEPFELQYQYGKRFEIAQTMVEYAKSPLTNNLKFPRLCLFTDIVESHTSISFSSELDLLLITATLPEYYSEQRLEINFKPILLPIYEALIQNMKDSRYIMGDFTFNKKDCYFYGATTKDGQVSNMYSDYLDAIEINSIKLKFNKYCI